MKKLLKIVAIFFAVLLLAAIIIPIALKGKIGEIVKREANKRLEAVLDFESLDISLLRRFPSASLELRGLTLTGVDKFEGDTIVAADRISVAVNIMSLFGDDGFEVSKVLLVRPSVYGHKLADGSVNWDVMKASDDVEEVVEDESGSSAFSLSLKAFDIEQATLRYDDDSTRMYASTAPLNLSLKGDMSASKTTLQLKLSAADLRYRTGDMTLLPGVAASLDAKIEADLENNRYVLSDNTLGINNISLTLNGSAELADEAVIVDLEANTSRVGFRDILSLVPAFYTRDFKNLTADGAMTLAAKIKGEMRGDILPAFDITLKVDNGSFKYASLPQGVSGINIDARVYGPGGTADATKVDVSRLTAAFAGNSLSGSLHVETPISDLAFSASARGNVDLAHIKDVYPLDESMTLAGKITADLKAAARMSDIEAERFEKISAEGSFAVEGMSAAIEGMPEVKISRAAASVNPQAMTLSELNVGIGRSDLSASGRLTNYMAYALRDDVLHGSLTLKSKLLDLNEIAGIDTGAESEAEPAADAAEESSSEGAPAIPKNLDLSLAATFDKVLLQKMDISDFTGSLQVRDGVLSVSKLAMKAFGGTVSAYPATYDTSDPSSPQLKLTASIANASFAETFNQLDMIKKAVPLFEKTGGDYSMKLDLSTRLGSDMSPVYNTLQASGEISSQNIRLHNIEALEKLTEALNSDKLRQADVKDIRISFTVKDGRVSTKPFDIKAGNVNINLSGSTGLDQTIDYTGKIALPEGAAGGILSTVGFNIGGTFSSPKITLGVKEAAKEAVTNAVNEGLKKLTGSENINEEFERQAAKLRAEAAAAGQKLVDEAKKQRENLINKSSNKLAQLAAEKSGDLLVKKAEEQSEKLQAEAEKQIEALRAKMNGGN
ncbi:MAG: AsmA family protein [Alistipes sp.]|nr:AsmA family protein [Alistipes sp.]